MNYQNIVTARFLSRPNRFIAHAELNGKTVVAHVKNTGRCRELLIPGVTVYLEHTPHPGRKTDYSLIAVDKSGLLINMDSQAPNRVAEEALRAGWAPQGIPGPIREIRRETTYYDSRIDLSFLSGETPALMEVKGVTLESDGKTFFPDAPTQRGIKHLRHLMRAHKEGYLAVALFVIQMEQANSFEPNEATHPEFSDALREASAAGVLICTHRCRVTPNSISMGNPVPVIL